MTATVFEKCAIYVNTIKPTESITYVDSIACKMQGKVSTFIDWVECKKKGTTVKIREENNIFKYHVFAPMGRFQLELIYLYFPPSFHLTTTVRWKDAGK